jgi:hypothetical protein
MDDKKMIRNNWQYVLALILILLLVDEILWYSPYHGPGKAAFSILNVVQQPEGSVNNANITYQINASLPFDATVLVTPVGEEPRDLPVFVFYDTDYPTVGTDWNLIAILQGHLDAQLRLRGYLNKAILVNATELEDTLLKKERAVLIIASGGFPSNVFSKSVNLVKPWVDSGGILVWFGWYIGYYSLDKGLKEEDITADMPQNPQDNGSKMLGLDGFFEYTDKNPEVALNPSPVSIGLDVTYDLILQAPLLNMVWAKGGLVLGKTGGQTALSLRPSVSMIPVGLGKIIIFGFFLMQSLTLNGPELAAWDIAQILCSGIVQMNASDVPWCRNYHLSAGESTIDTFSFTAGTEVAGFVVFEYTSRSSDGVLFNRQFIHLTG